MARKARDPFDLTLSDEQRQLLAHFLATELQAGLDARATQEVEVDYWWQLYEQARTRLGRNMPWPDAADLTSHLPAEKVDALQARLLRTIWSDPVCHVEGWGEAAQRAPFVEEFHQWKIEEERLQGTIDKLLMVSLVEPRGLLEVSEGTALRTTRAHMTAKLDTDPVTGGLIYDADGSPQLARDAEGTLIEAQSQDMAAETVVDRTDRVRTGPVYRVLPYRDSVILPGHARDKADIWGYFKRFWTRLAEVQRKGEAGFYDDEAVARLSNVGDREGDAALARAHQDVAPQVEPLSEKELWEGTVLLDLNALFVSRHLSPLRDRTFNGDRWFLVTLHLPSFQLLRVQHDDLERSRFVPVILFPRPDRVTEGFSFVGHKLITVAEEHTAWRNMAADRASLVVQAPIKRLQGALWDPVEQPWGPKAVIDVRDMREVEPMVVPDVTAPVLTHIQMLERTADRLAGINDIAAGQISQESRTLGEIQMATTNAEIRMDLITRRFDEALEDLYQIRHAIWQRTLAERADGVDAPAALLTSLEGRGVSIDAFLPDKKITAQLLEGAFQFKPHGSVETADLTRARGDWVAFLQALGPLLQVFPALIPILQTPQAARAVFRQCLRVFRVENQQAFLGSPAQDLQQDLQAQMGPLLAQLMGGGAPIGPGGGPPGAGLAPPPGVPPAGLPPGPGRPQ